MTRSFLINIAHKVHKKPIESYTDSTYFGVIYLGLYGGKPFQCLYDSDDHLVAICYNRVVYCVCAVDRSGAFAIREFEKTNHSTTKVMLYRNYLNLLFRDSDGDYVGYEDCKESSKRDYSDCIPIPIKL